jgi:hypothetical protein
VAGTFLLRKAESPGARLLLDFALLAACSIAIQVTWVYFQYGLFMQTTMLDLRNAFKAYLDLLQLPALGGVAPALALLYALANRHHGRTRQQLNPQQQEVESQATAAD